MTATLNSTKHKTYHIIIRYKDKSSGKNRQKWINTNIEVKGNNKRKAEKVLDEIKYQYRDIEEEIVSQSNTTLFIDYLKTCLENDKISLSPVTYDTYRLILYNQLIPFYKDKKLVLSEVQPQHIREYIKFKLDKEASGKMVSNNTVRKHLIVISKYMNWAVKEELISSNPVQKINLPKQNKYTGASYYSYDEIKKLLNITKDDLLGPLIFITLFYGLRRSEVLGLKWDAIDFDKNTIHIKHTVVRVGSKIHAMDATKNQKSNRIFPLVEATRKVFLDIQKKQKENNKLCPNDYIKSDYVFTDILGKLLGTSYVSKRFTRLLKKNNLRVIRFHDLRHSSATYLHSLGFSAKELQEWLGHSNIGITMNIYTHSSIKEKLGMANMLNDKLKI